MNFTLLLLFILGTISCYTAFTISLYFSFRAGLSFKILKTKKLCFLTIFLSGFNVNGTLRNPRFSFLKLLRKKRIDDTVRCATPPHPCMTWLSNKRKKSLYSLVMMCVLCWHFSWLYVYYSYLCDDIKKFPKYFYLCLDALHDFFKLQLWDRRFPFPRDSQKNQSKKWISKTMVTKQTKSNFSLQHTVFENPSKKSHIFERISNTTSFFF